MKHYLKICSKITLMHLIVQVFAVCLGPLVFMVVLGSSFGWKLMCTALSIAYVVTIYSEAYKIGQRDTKSYSTHKPYAAKGLILPVLTLVISSVLLILYHICFLNTFASFDAQMWYNAIVKLLTYGWNFTFEGFRIASDGTIHPLYYVLVFGAPVVSCFLGYLLGMKHYELGYQVFSRLVYKRKEKK